MAIPIFSALFNGWLAKKKIDALIGVGKLLGVGGAVGTFATVVKKQAAKHRKQKIIEGYDREILSTKEAIKALEGLPGDHSEDLETLRELQKDIEEQRNELNKYETLNPELAELAEKAIGVFNRSLEAQLRAQGLDELADRVRDDRLSNSDLEEVEKLLQQEGGAQAVFDFLSSLETAFENSKKSRERKPPRAKEIKSIEFNEQAFMIVNVEQFKNRIKYKNFVKVEGGDPYRFYSKATTSQKVSQFINATPQELSGLIPYIKIWKITYPRKGHDGVPVELKFKNHFSDSDIEAMTHGRGNRGAGVGIKSFSWDMSGSNQASAGKLITSTMVVVFQDINSLTAETNGVSYLDLIRRSTQYEETQKCKNFKIWNSKYYRIKIQVGWSASRESEDLNSLHDAVKISRRNFYLSMFGHDINFKDDGTIELTLNLQSTIESLMRSVDTDILLMDKNKELIKLEEKYCAQENKRSVSDIEDSPKAEQAGIKEELEKLKNSINEEKSTQYRNFLEKMEQRGFIHYIDVPPEHTKMWNISRQGGIGVSGETDIEKETDAKAKLLAEFENDTTKYFEWREKKITGNQFKESEAKSYRESLVQYNKLEAGKKIHKTYDKTKWIHGGGLIHGSSYDCVLEGRWSKENNEYALAEDSKRMHYIYLGSIIEVALSVLRPDSGSMNKIEEMRNIVGIVDFIDPKNGNSPFTLSLADIPISFRLFQNWFFEACVKRELSFWHLSRFLLALVDSLFISAVRTEENIKTVSGQPHLKIATDNIPLYPEGGGVWSCPFTGAKTVREFNEKESIDGERVFMQDREFNFSSSGKDGKYFFMHMGNFITEGIFSHDPNTKMADRKIIDEKSGISHFKIGSTRGLIKNIKFKKMDFPALKAFKLLRKGHSALGGISELYNADIEMVGNVMYKPGSFIYIDTSALSSEISLTHEMGLGGYYMITSIKSEINFQSFNTTLHCVWSSSGMRKSTAEPPIKPLTAEKAPPAVGDS